MIPQRVVLIGVAVAALWFGYPWLFPNDDAQIRSVLERIAEAVGSGAEQQGDVSRLARAAAVRNQLDPQITVDAGPPFSRMSGRDAIIGTIARMNGTVSDLEVVFADVQITVDPTRSSAKVYLTAQAQYRDGGGARGLEARELDLTFRRLDGDWVVSDVARVRTLEPITPR
jgi:hypothetical protein